MKVFIQSRAALNETLLLDRLAASVERAGHQRSPIPDGADAAIVWGTARAWPGQPTLFCEQGWLPRWHYQVSHTGINGRHHARASDNVLPRRTSIERARALTRLYELRALAPEYCENSFAYADPRGKATTFAPGERFLLVPLQVEQDTNRTGSNFESMQEFVDFVAAHVHCPLYIRHHPALLARGQTVHAPRECDFVAPLGLTVHQVLKHPGCLGVVTLNSNTAHDALVWGKPALALDAGFWPPGGGPICTTWRAFEERLAGENTEEHNGRLADYVSHVLATQWSPDDAANPDRVNQALRSAMLNMAEK